jgi:hypothetical protein
MSKNCRLLSAVISLCFLFLLFCEVQSQGAQEPKEQASTTVQGVLDEVNIEMLAFTLLDAAGERHNLSYDKETIFLSGKSKVTPSVLNKGLKATVTYKKEVGPSIMGGLSPVLYVATKVQLDASARLVSTPQRFIDNKDGTVTDTETRLMWQKKDDGKQRTWDEAQNYCKKLTLGGYKDWRLPEPKERDDAVVVALLPQKTSKGTQPKWCWSNDPNILIPFNYYPTSRVYFSNILVKEGAKAYLRAVRDLSSEKNASEKK